MILVMKNEQTATQAVIKIKQQTTQLVFQHANRIGLPGVKQLSELPFIAETMIDEVITKHPSALKSSRLFHPADTVIQTAHSTIGGDALVLMAGPDALETPDHVRTIGAAAKQAGATILRGGSFKPRTNPYSFQGIGEIGLQWHRQAADALGMDMITEVMDTRDVALIGQYTDIFQVGARNMQNFSLLKELGAQDKPVALKRGMSATIDEWLSAAEYLAAAGNDKIILIERGVRSFDNTYTRNMMDVSAIPVLRSLTHYPVLADPSHAAGVAQYVPAIGLAAVAAGAQGLMVELHDQPEKALVDGAQALTTPQFAVLAQQARHIKEITRG